ncbi:MAG: hypothetical protein LBS39_04620 [Campylobacteraceae bacterium]|jgi:hypothetical protein|nr:hypothetical protein [Campylobacteraceae bacterium]
MKKKISNKILEAENLLKENSAAKDDIDNLNRWLGYFQHERLIHLIVTVFVGLSDMISIIVLFLASNYVAFALTVLLSILFIFYIIHYYVLENGVQKLYDLIDALHKKAK